ncbi:PAS domain S-box protein [bacterium]|nr:PAS domain S-box protein [bacterium]
MSLEFSIETSRQTQTRQGVLEAFWRSLLSAGEAAALLSGLAEALSSLTGCAAVAYCLDPDSGELTAVGSLHAPGLCAPRPEALEFPEAAAPLRLDLSAAPDSTSWGEFIAVNRAALEGSGWRLAWALPAAGRLAALVFLCAGTRLQRRSARTAAELALRAAVLGLERLAAREQVRRASFEYRLKLLEIETLRDVGVALGGLLDLDCLCRELLARAASLLNAERAAVLLAPVADSSGESVPLAVKESFNLEPGQAEALEQFVRGSLIADLSGGLALRLNLPGALPSATGCGKLLAAPVRHKGVLLGALLAADKEGRHGARPDFDPEDEGLLTAIANFAGAAVSNANLYRSVNEIRRYNESILASIASGVITTGAGGKIVSFNASAAAIFGLEPAAAAGLSLEQLFASIGCPGLPERLRPALERGVAFQETSLRGVRPDGAELVLNVSAAALLDEESGGVRGLVVSVENISEPARVREMLKRYVSPEVAEAALSGGRIPGLGGELREVTVLFADIRGFTALAEARAPDEVVELLNRYYNLMIEVAFSFKGTVDKIVGDEIMVLFGAPVAFPDDNRRAALCALAMLRELERFNRERRGPGQPPLEAGIGLGRGTVIFGNIGSRRRMDYTVIGDTVNLASRLVAVARPGQIVVSDSVAESLGAQFSLQELGRLHLKGRREPVLAWSLTDGPRQ